MAVTQRVIMLKRKRMTARNKRKNIKVSSGGIGTPPGNQRVLRFTNRGEVYDNSSYTRTKHKVGTKSESTFGFGEVKGSPNQILPLKEKIASPLGKINKEESGPWGFNSPAKKSNEGAMMIDYKYLMSKLLEGNQRSIDSLNLLYKNIITPKDKNDIALKDNIDMILKDFEKMQLGMTKSYLESKPPISLDSKKPFKGLADYIEALERVSQYNCDYKTKINKFMENLNESLSKKTSKKEKTFKNAVLRALSVKKKAPLNKAQQISLLRRKNPNMSIDEAAQLLMKKG